MRYVVAGLLAACTLAVLALALLDETAPAPDGPRVTYERAAVRWLVGLD